MKRILSALILIFCLFPPQIVRAQDNQKSGPVYVVQDGDTFYSIAIKFNVTIDQIVAANPDVNPNMLTVGTEVVIPGLEGIQGKLLTETIPLGETLRTLSIRNEAPLQQISKLNRITSPGEVFAGASLIIPEQDQTLQPQNEYLIGNGQSLFQLSVQKNANPWLLAETNQVDSTWDILPGEAIFEKPAQAPDKDTPQVSLISPVIKDIQVNPLPIEQGETTTIKVTTSEPVEFSGNLAGHDLHFFPDGENTYVALQGVYVMSDPGIYPLTLQGKLSDNTQFSFEQNVVLKELGYASEAINGVDPVTIDPKYTKPEDDEVQKIVSPATPDKYWDGMFTVPGFDPTWITSTFGTRRSYNGSAYTYFHSGLDYGGGVGLPIKSPAAGKVVFAGPLTIRGNATFIDHGWGIYSGIYHQSEFKVKVGDMVEAGQEIGLYGKTGRVTGPHLHWDLWVNGVQVDPYTWLGKVFP